MIARSSFPRWGSGSLSRNFRACFLSRTSNKEIFPPFFFSMPRV
nr:MAG TPA: hypothetical protein [Caudoviricetes sp.]